ncbi:MAG TPA: enolase C-terminal domain-like protein [Pyrinomonadaceae bacterium]|nr:enolase C-terminal domain-like protein [Pyrinomonadaceae bacterium]
MTITIIDIKTIDLRFPTSRSLDGSDAMNVDPDYSAAYVILRTDSPSGLEGHGLTFTIGRGNDLCCRAIEMIGSRLIGRTLSSLTTGNHALWELVTGDSQYRWLGPEKGIIHLATAAVVNTVWDLFAKAENKPLWKLLVDLPSEEIVAAVPFRYITDALTPAEALEILKRHEATRAEREAELRDQGFPAYTTSAGWLGYTDERIRELVREAIAAGWSEFKMKVGRNLEDDLRRAALIREEIGWDRTLMVDANQVWDVPQAIEWMKELARFKPLWIEEPTSPDDIMGHAAIARAIAPIGVASGEHCQNRVMFKQFLAAGALSFCQIDSCRIGGVNEVLAVLLLAAKFDVPVCPHAGGVGLCEYVQHLSAFDYIAVSGSLKGRRIEFVDHLHEHFIDPVVIRNGHYRLPTAPGYSITMKPPSLEQYAYPNGDAWRVDKVQ